MKSKHNCGFLHGAGNVSELQRFSLVFDIEKVVQSFDSFQAMIYDEEKRETTEWVGRSGVGGGGPSEGEMGVVGKES